MHWQDIWAWLHTWQGFVPAILAAAATIYYGPRKVLETWDWYLDRFRDQKVMDIVKMPRALYSTRISTYGHERSAIDIPYTIKEISNKLKRSPRSVVRSLRRLERRGKAKETDFGWQFKED